VTPPERVTIEDVRPGFLGMNGKTARLGHADDGVFAFRGVRLMGVVCITGT